MFTFLDHLLALLLILTLGAFGGVGKNQEILDGGCKMAPFENVTYFLRHTTSSAHVTNCKGNIFGRTI